MIATMGMVLDGLSRLYSCRQGSAYDPDYEVVRSNAIRASRFLTPSSMCCYVLDKSVVPDVSVPESSLVVASSDDGERYPCAILVGDEVPLDTLRNEITKIICSYESWASELLHISLRSVGLEELVDCAHELFGNPITVIDQDYQILSQTFEDEMEDAQWVPYSRNTGVPLVLEGRVDAAIEESGFVRYLEDLRKYIVLRDYMTESGELLSACVALDDGKYLVAVNVVRKNRAITDGDMGCIRFFAKVVGSKIKAMGPSPRYSSSSYAALLHDVTSGALTDPVEIRARLNSCWIKVKPHFTVLTVASSRGLLKYYQLCQIEDDLESIIEEGKGVIYERSLVVFANHDGPIDEAGWHELESYIRENRLIAGMSESSDDEGQLGMLVSQARFAVKMCDREGCNEGVAKFKEYRHLYLYEICSREADWPRYLHPCLRTIEEHDGRESLPLMPTLSCLVENGGNKTLTAKALGIQRNTLQYRLAKIESLCSVNLSNEDVFDDIVFSVKLRQYCEGELPFLAIPH